MMASSISEDYMDITDRMLLAKPKFLTSVPGGDNASVSSIPVTTSGNTDSNDTPIFSKRKMTLRLPKDFNGDLLHVTVCKNWMVCLVAAPPPSSQVTLFRIFLPRAALPPGGNNSINIVRNKS